MRASIVRSVRLVALALAVAGVLAACSPSAPSDSPAGVVEQAIDLAAKKDLDGLQGLACAGQEAMIEEQLGLSGGMDLGAMKDMLGGLGG